MSDVEIIAGDAGEILQIGPIRIRVLEDGARTDNRLGFPVELFLGVLGRLGLAFGGFLRGLGLILQAVRAIFESGFARLFFLRVAGGESEGSDDDE